MKEDFKLKSNLKQTKEKYKIRFWMNKSSTHFAAGLFTGLGGS
jgi:hypothetical protein